MHTGHEHDSSRSSNPLISSSRVEGTEVYGLDDNHIGEIHHMMIDKISGNVAYVVVSFGGILGFANKYYPLPWDTFSYDLDLSGYRVEITKEQLEQKFDHADDPDFDWSKTDWLSKFQG